MNAQFLQGSAAVHFRSRSTLNFIFLCSSFLDSKVNKLLTLVYSCHKNKSFTVLFDSLYICEQEWDHLECRLNGPAHLCMMPSNSIVQQLRIVLHSVIGHCCRPPNLYHPPQSQLATFGALHPSGHQCQRIGM